MTAQQPDSDNKMPTIFQLPDAEALVFDKKALLASAKSELRTFYATNDDPMYRACGAAVAAVLNAITPEIAKALEIHIAAIYLTHEKISLLRDEQVDDDARAFWDEALANSLEMHFIDVRNILGDETRWEELAGESVGFHEVGRIAEIASALAYELKSYYMPPANGVGKFLSRYGIVDADLNKLATAAKKIPMPAAPVVETKVVFARPAIEEVPLPPPVETETVVPPTKEELANAIGWWAEGSGPEPISTAESLEMSVGTLRNYIKRKTLPKINSSQARYLAGDCRDCIVKLERALAIFERVKPTGGGDA